MKDILPLEVSTINSKHIQNLVDSLYLKGFKASTIGCYVTRIRSIFEYYRKTYNKDYTNPTLSLLMHKKERREFTLIEDIQKILVWTKNNFSEELKAFKEKGIIFNINPYTFSNGYCRNLKKEYGV